MRASTRSKEGSPYLTTPTTTTTTITKQERAWRSHSILMHIPPHISSPPTRTDASLLSQRQ